MSVAVELPWDARLARALGETGSAFQRFRDHANVLWTAVLVLVFAAVTGLAAQVSITLPFTPVPITAQVGAVLLASGFLGSWRGALSQFAYVAIGVFGAPWFAPAAHAPVFSSSGLAVLEGVNGGYLIGFIVAALVVGLLLETRWFGGSYAGKLSALLVGIGVIYLAGSLQLAYLLHTDPTMTVAYGIIPFVPGDVMKAVLVAGLTAGLTVPRGTGAGPATTFAPAKFTRWDLGILIAVTAAVWVVVGIVAWSEPSLYQFTAYSTTVIDEFYVAAAIVATIGVALAVLARQRLVSLGERWSSAWAPGA